MIKITKTKENGNELEFLVEVEKDGVTEHKVTVDRDFLKELTAEDLIKKSFEFLLERESNQSILKEFNLRIISSYFPEYEKVIKN